MIMELLLNDMDNLYKNMGDYNPNQKCLSYLMI